MSDNLYFNPKDHLNRYSHRQVDVPIRGHMFGVELEYLGDIDPISNFGKEFNYLLGDGWELERDGSVSFEMKSPVLSLEEIKLDFTRCKDLFKAWAENTDPDGAGLHVHVSFDDMFAVGKKPVMKSFLFLTNLTQEIESKLFNNAENRKKTFKRDFNSSYARSSIGATNINNSRYYWFNLQNLDREVGKTIEFRLGSASLASELDVYVEKVYILAKFIKLAIKDWRDKDRHDFNNWKDSFGDTKILKALMPKEFMKRFVELFG